jgi:GT2 family glycosyltransferase
MTCDARYVLFLNPDTEVLEGTFAELLDALDRRPAVGLIGVKQLTPDGDVFPTIRWFPNALRAFGEAVGSERFPFRTNWFGERELRMELYERDTPCDWTSGSFMLARREALESAGYLDERFFLFGEEPDLCLRVKKAGWEVRHLPSMTILHHADTMGINPRMKAQSVFSRMQYAQKHFSFAHRSLYCVALGIRYTLRALPRPGGDAHSKARRQASRAAVRVLLGLDDAPPFRVPPPTAVSIREFSES